MKRVLVIEGSGNLWGSERALLDLMDSAPALKVAVCCPPDRPLQAELEKRHIRILPYFVYGLHDKSRYQRLRAAIGVLRACLEFRPDVIYLNQSGSYKICLPAAALLSVPIVAHIRIFEDAAYLARQRPSTSRLHALIAISTTIEKEIRGHLALKDIPVHRIYDGYVRAPDPPGTALDLRVANRVACVGRVVPIKGQDILVEAMAVLIGSIEDAQCLIVGDGDRTFIDAIRRVQTSAAPIRWLGIVKDVVPLLRTCPVLACPSHREPLGRVIFEAWDAGAIPVVYSGSGGAAEVVRQADGGILYDEQTPKSLAAALKAALSLDQETAARMIKNGRAWMVRHCDPTVYGQAITAILSTSKYQLVTPSK